MAKVIDMPGYYRIPADTSGLSYKKYFDLGEEKVTTIFDYTSESMNRLSVKEIKTKLLPMNYVTQELEICMTTH